MKKSHLIILLSAVLILFGVYFTIRLIQSNQSSPEPKETVELIAYHAKDGIRTIRFIDNLGSDVSLYRSSGSWHLRNYADIPISDSRMALFCSNLEYLLALRSIKTPSADLSAYGLDDPICVFSLATDTSDDQYAIGAYSSYYNGYYLENCADGKIYIVESSYRNLFDIPVSDLFIEEKLPDMSDIVSISFLSAGGNLTTDEDSKELIAILQSMKITGFIDYKKEFLPRFGMDNPSLCTISYQKDGETAEISLTLGRGESDEYTYIRIGRSQAVYKFTCENMDLLHKLMDN